MAKNRHPLTDRGAGLILWAMLICLVLLIFSTALTPILSFLLIRHYFEAKQAEIVQSLETLAHSWVDPTPDGKESKLAVLVDSLGAVVGSSAARSLMATFKQSKSSEAVAANGISAALEAEQNPLLSIIASTRRGGKGAAFQRLVGLLAPMLLSKGNNGGTPSGSAPTQAQGTLSL